MEDVIKEIARLKNRVAELELELDRYGGGDGLQDETPINFGRARLPGAKMYSSWNIFSMMGNDEGNIWL